ncbi:MAG: hypothetical protein IJT77_11695 [Clostridia bacterium]|nr:hypothetical protein [Clostridia bacterium]
MLIKLLKHDLISMGRLLAPIMLAMLALSAVIGFNVRTQYKLENVGTITVILFAILFALIFLAFFLTFILTIFRFRQNLLGNQGYLSLALPVSTAEHIAGKFLASMIWTCVNGIVAVISFWLIYTVGIPAAGRQLGAVFFKRLFPDFDPYAYLTLENFLLLVTSMSEGVLHMYLAIAIGHLWQKHAILGAILGYVLLSIARSQLFTRLLQPMSLQMPFATFSIISALVFSAIYAVCTWLILDRHLNLE